MQSPFLDFHTHSPSKPSLFQPWQRPRIARPRPFSLLKYVRTSSRLGDEFYHDSTRVLKSKDLIERKQQLPAPSFRREEPKSTKQSRVKHRPEFQKDRRVGKSSKRSRLRIGVHETSDGVVLDLRQLRAKRKRIMKKGQLSSSCSLVACDVKFPALLLLKNHSLAHASVKQFLRQMLDRYSDSLEIILQSNQIGCLPPPDQFVLDSEEVSFSDSETYVDEQEWFMEVESQQYLIEEELDLDVLYVEDLKYFSEALGFPQEEDSSLIDL